MPGAQRVGGDAGAIEASGHGPVAEHPGHDVVAERLFADPGEQGSGLVAAEPTPRGESGCGVGAVGDRDDRAEFLLVGLGVSDGDQDSGGLGLEGRRG